MLSGSEGTLDFITEIILHVDRLPPWHDILVYAHFRSVEEAMQAKPIAMKHSLYVCELIDHFILNGLTQNRI
ncbi:MAG: hypothetical protein ABI045_06510 [Flavobacteriales bacterium]